MMSLVGMFGPAYHWIGAAWTISIRSTLAVLEPSARISRRVALTPLLNRYCRKLMARISDIRRALLSRSSSLGSVEAVA